MDQNLLLNLLLVQHNLLSEQQTSGISSSLKLINQAVNQIREHKCAHVSTETFSTETGTNPVEKITNIVPSSSACQSGSLISNESCSVSTSSNPNRTTKKNVSSPKVECIFIQETEDTQEETESMCSDETETIHTPEIENPLNSEIEKSSICNYSSAFTSEQRSMPLYKLLDDKNNLIGNIILWKYSRTRDISLFRKSLCKMIVNKEMALTMRSPWPLTIHSLRFGELCASIIELFEGEQEFLYFKPGYLVKDPLLTKFLKVNSTGILYTEYIKMREFARQAGLLTPKAVNRSVIHKASIVPRTNTTPTGLAILYEDSDVEQHKKMIYKVWNSSYKYRHTSDNLKDVKGTEIIQIFQVLKTQLAPSLILSDFEKSYNNELVVSPVVSSKLFSLWPVISKQIITVAKYPGIINIAEESDRVKYEINFTIPNYTDINDIFDKNPCLFNNDHVNALAFFLIFHLLHYSKKCKLTNNVWKPNKTEVVESFIQHIENHDKFDEIKERVKENIKSHGLEEYPYIVCCGPLHNLNCCHVVFSDFEYNFTDIIKAVDFAYKLFFELKINYPIASAHIWCFFQKYVYCMTTFRRIIANRLINELIVEIEKA